MYNIKIYRSRALLFFLLFPYIYPIGLDAIPVFKILFIIWGLVSMVCVVYLYFFRGFVVRLYPALIIVFHFFLLIITLYINGDIPAGLKKLFLFPCAVLLCDLWCRKNPKLLLKTMLDVFFFEQIFNLLFWNVKIFENDQFLLGIRTDFPIVGFLTIYVALLCRYLKIGGTKYKAYIAIVASILSIFLAWVSTGIVALLLLFALLVMIRFRWFERLLNFCDNTKLIPLGIFLNYGFVFSSTSNIFSGFITSFLGESTDLNGRGIIWKLTLRAVAESPWLGYGVYGIYIEMPEWWGVSYNYVHTQSLQLLIDGGIVALVCFLLILIVIGKEINRGQDYFIKKLSTIVLFACMIMMIPEVITNYCWSFVLLTLLADSKVFAQLREE
ncbi:O-antigen ligase [Bacillus sp. SORGH_AS 510]|uniref:O-antigen ligase family protein n=1 Tax=Bacillus sp. SORGH_AS_0510 TaxID=3041771 RepID=UPI0027869599|nr:O-antigen ligase family protein [Bacillus sp. SORGH_AS_0510]MDQ1143766.1 O-antigen ligase [Bacillus sp. SORGH_AS_0510]